MKIIRNIILAFALALPLATLAHPSSASAFSAAQCHFIDNGIHSEWVGCLSTGMPWRYVQIWLYCSNNPNVAVRGNRVEDPVDGVSWRYSAASCGSYTKHHWVYAYWNW